MVEKIKLAFPKSKFTVNDDGSYTVKLYINKFLDRTIQKTSMGHILITFYYKGYCGEDAVYTDFSHRMFSLDDRALLESYIKNTIRIIAEYFMIEYGTKIHVEINQEEFTDYVDSILYGARLTEK